MPRNGVTEEHFLVALEKLTAFDLVAVLDENSREIAWCASSMFSVVETMLARHVSEISGPASETHPIPHKSEKQYDKSDHLI